MAREHTPMMKQYLEIKRNYRDAFLFFRLGDFYELFYEDAEKAAALLEITLTARAGKYDDKIPMCGVPYHSAENYIETLVKNGHKVAICEQVEDPAEAKGIVRREVVKIVTPGTLTEGKTSNRDENHFIGAYDGGEEAFIAYVDVATGEGRVEQIDGTIEEKVNQFAALQLKELIVAQSEYETFEAFMQAKGIALSVEETLEEEVAIQHLVHQIPQVAHQAVSRLMNYVYVTQKTSLTHIRPFRLIEKDDKLTIDANSMRNLELTKSLRTNQKKGTLFDLLDETSTAMGARLLSRWIYEPLANKEAIERRLNLVEAWMTAFLERATMKESLKKVYDLERLAGRIAMNTATGRDLAQMRDSLQVIPTIVEQLYHSQEPALQAIAPSIDACEPLTELLTKAIADEPPISVKEAGVIRDGYHEQLDEYRHASRNGKEWLAALEAKERERTGIKNLKINYNRVFGYFIEVTKANIHLVDEERYERKQTLTNSERYITEELKEKEYLILNAEEDALTLEYELFREVREKAQQYIERVQKLAMQIASLDVLLSFADVAEKYQYVRPTFHEGHALEIEEGRHPVVEKMQPEEWFVPNDCLLTEESNMLLITGPNMSGKSTYMRQVALIVIMAQLGSFVPAARAHLPITDQIFTRIGASDDLASGQSTFMVEMKESQYAITHATRRSLLLFDEIGRGTSTYDGMALAQSMMEYIHETIGANTLFSTHYHELTVLEETLPQLRNVHVAATEEDGEVVFLHKVQEGAADRSYGIHVASLAGLPEEILTRANDLLHMFESSNNEEKVSSPTPIEQVPKEQAPIKKEPMMVEEKQLSLFEEPVLDEVRQAILETDILHTSPIEALTLINDWQKQLMEEKK